MAERLRELTLYVIRHGECEHNVLGPVAAQDDSPLTARGREHGRRNGEILRRVAGDLDGLDFFASSLHRTCHTMELVRDAAGLPTTGYRADRRLMEGDLGDQTWLDRDVVLNHPPYLADPWNFVRPGGESLAMIDARVRRFLATLTRDAVIVTHYLPAAMIRGCYLGQTPDEIIAYEPPHAGVLGLARDRETFFDD